jgi:hypothetical protein
VKEMGGELSLSFVAIQPTGMPGAVYLAEALDPTTGAFEVKGPTGKGIPPGKYKIQLRHILSGEKSLIPESLGTDSTPLGGDEYRLARPVNDRRRQESVIVTTVSCWNRRCGVLRYS